MNIIALRNAGVLGLAALLAILTGYYITVVDAFFVAYLVAAFIGLLIMLWADYIPLISFGLICPFILPIPVISFFPFIVLVVAACYGRYLLNAWVDPRTRGDWGKGFILSFSIFFSLVLTRYCMNPAVPNATGFGETVTGFRSYLNYAVCVMVLVALSLFVRTIADAKRVICWIGGCAALFCLILIPFVLSKSVTAARVFSYLGLYVSFFDNGCLRFVVLPLLGTLLVGLAMLPALFVKNRFGRLALLVLGAAAVVLGGNRSTFAVMLTMVCCIALVRKRILQFSFLVGAAAGVLMLFYVIGEHLPAGELGFLRVLALTSSRVAQRTDAADSVVWRKIRWTRAIEDIKSSPIFGKGYGGLQNAFLWSNRQEYENELVEVDVASGGIHNGYLAAARSLGIPAAVIFIYLLLRQIIFNAKRAFKHVDSAPLISQLHCYIFANLVGFALTIYIGTDVNAPSLWAFLGLGLVLDRIRKTEETRGPRKISSVAPTGLQLESATVSAYEAVP